VPAGTTNSIGFVGSQAATLAAGARATRRRPRNNPAIRLELRVIRVLLFECASETAKMGLIDGSDRVPTSGRRAPARVGSRARSARQSRASTDPGPAIRGRLLSGPLLPERNHARDLPLVPHLVHLGLEVPEVFLGKVGKAPVF